MAANNKLKFLKNKAKDAFLITMNGLLGEPIPKSNIYQYSGILQGQVIHGIEFMRAIPLLSNPEVFTISHIRTKNYIQSSWLTAASCHNKLKNAENTLATFNRAEVDKIFKDFHASIIDSMVVRKEINTINYHLKI